MKKPRPRLKYLWASLLAGLITAFLFGWVPVLSQTDRPAETSRRPVEAVYLTNHRPPLPEEEPRRRKEPPPPQPPPQPRRVSLPRPDSPQPSPAPPQIELAGLNLEINPQLASGLSLDLPPASPLPPDRVAGAVRGDPTGGHGPTAAFETSQVDRQPRVIRQVPPIYPFSARRRGISGEVVVRFLVDREGRVDRLAFVKAEPPGVFEESVRQAVSRWRFTPGLYQGRPVPTWVVLPIKFRLEG